MKNVFTHILLALAISAIALVSSRADDKTRGAQNRASGPKGGLLLEKTEPKAEFFLNKDRSAVITFYDAALKPVPAGAQTARLVVNAKGGRQQVDFEKKGDVLLSKTTIAEGDALPVVLQLKSNADAKPQNFRFKLDTSICGGCKRAEYACTCDE
ncbi:MAG: hypothetical protein L0Y58_19895 [Verrucomicrobia subdivision 3 bacterium]|nr:hypothetical protein [Limisphaerales bacterium]